MIQEVVFAAAMALVLGLAVGFLIGGYVNERISKPLFDSFEACRKGFEISKKAYEDHLEAVKNLSRMYEKQRDELIERLENIYSAKGD